LRNSTRRKKRIGIDAENDNSRNIEILASHFEKKQVSLLSIIVDLENQLANKNEQIEEILFELYEAVNEKQKTDKDYSQLLRKYESFRSEYFYTTSLISSYETKLIQEWSRTSSVRQELLDSKESIKIIQKQYREIAVEYDFLLETLRKTADDYAETIEMIIKLKTGVEMIQEESERYIFMHNDTLASAKFKVGEAVIAAMKNPLKIFVLPIKLIKIVLEKRKYDKTQEETAK